MHIEDHIAIKGSGQCDPGRGHWSHTGAIDAVAVQGVQKASFLLNWRKLTMNISYLQNIYIYIYVYAIIHIHIHMFKKWIKAIRIIINAGITLSDLFFYYIIYLAYGHWF